MFSLQSVQVDKDISHAKSRKCLHKCALCRKSGHFPSSKRVSLAQPFASGDYLRAPVQRIIPPLPLILCYVDLYG